MAFLVAMPSLLLPNVSTDTSQITVLVALLAFLMVFIEYYSQYPSIIEFRYASPFNRLRFLALFEIVTLLSVILASPTGSNPMANTLTQLGTAWGTALDFPFSPVRLVVLMMPEYASAELISSVRTSAGIAYMVSLVALFIFVTMVRLLGWPTRNRAFNVWINLPTFDPTAGTDVVKRLNRDARVNIILGFVLPYITPPLAAFIAANHNLSMFSNDLTLVWTVTLWAFLPASLFMRGIAMHRLSDMIEAKRKRLVDASMDHGDGLHAF